MRFREFRDGRLHWQCENRSETCTFSFYWHAGNFILLLYPQGQHKSLIPGENLLRMRDSAQTVQFKRFSL